MFNIGAHLSAAKGFLHMGEQAVYMGGNTFQFFTRNPRGANAKKLNLKDVSSFLEYIEKLNFAPIIAHAPYTLNPCSNSTRVRELAFDIISDDLLRMEHLPGNYYNMHPGSHVQQGVRAGVDLIADLLNRTLFSEQSTTVLLETMSGKGSEVGKTFEELYMIMDKIKLNSKIGICMDLCHAWDSGYNLAELEKVLSRFDQVIGLSNLKAIHVNDSKNPLNSHKDRHEVLGSGTMGMGVIKQIINYPKLTNLPFILETPTDVDGHKAEIEMLKKLYHS